jgi:hypothetical protein
VYRSSDLLRKSSLVHRGKDEDEMNNGLEARKDYWRADISARGTSNRGGRQCLSSGLSADGLVNIVLRHIFCRLSSSGKMHGPHSSR